MQKLSVFLTFEVTICVLMLPSMVTSPPSFLITCCNKKPEDNIRWFLVESTWKEELSFDCLELVARSSLAILESLLRFALILLDCREDSEASSQDLFKLGVESLSAVVA